MLKHAAFALGAALALAGTAEAAAPFPAETFTLDNGLQVVVLPNHRAPIVSTMVWYKVGAADEVAGKSGLAHFLEHLMFKGTKTVPPGEFAKIVAANGGNDNAFTTQDYTGYFENLAADRLELAIKLEADRMTGLVLTDAVVLPEREVILEERRTRIDNSALALFEEQIDAALYLNQPYHKPTIGWESEMNGLTTDDALAFYRRWYAPNNAVLVIAGDAETSRVRELAEKYFGPLQRHDVPARFRVAEPPKVAAITLSMTSPRVGSASWSRTYLAPSYNSGKGREAYALQLFGEIFGGNATSRLYRAVVLDKGLAYGAGTEYSPQLMGLASFTVYAQPKTGIAAADIDAAVTAQVRQVLKDGVTGAELDGAKRRLQANMIYNFDSLSGTARLVGAAIASGRTLDDVLEWSDRIQAVTLDEVNAAARNVIHDDVAVTGILLPAPGTHAPSAGLPPVRSDGAVQ